MSEKKEIKISAAKGRPMLTWVGKRPLRSVTAFPAQHVETFNPHPACGHPLPLKGVLNRVPEGEEIKTSPSPSGRGAGVRAEACHDWPAAYPHGGLLFHGDNKEVLGHLLANGFRGKVKLIYIDPPFDSGADYVRRVQLRGVEGSTTIEGESYALGEQIQYSDIWANDNYLQFMYERIVLLKELMNETSSILLHCDWHRSHVLRCIMDEVFGSENLQNEIIWQRTDPHNDAKSRLGWVHDVIMWYRKGESVTYNWKDVVEPLSPAALKEYSLVKLDDGSIQSFSEELNGENRRFKLDDCTWKGNDPSRRFEWRGARPSDKRVWPYDLEGMDKAVESGEFYLRDQNQGAARCRVSYLDEREGQVLQTIWTECGRMKGGSDYPTKKPWALLSRIIQAFSNPDDLVLDCFIGSGTTAAVAQKLGRRWIGCDINKGAIQTTAKRLQAIMAEQQAAAMQESPQSLPGMESDEAASPLPAQLSFGVWRVNDYDLKIQRNEAIKLACEHVGVERLASDSFFDGKLGKKLVKITPFEHPLSPLDLEDLKRELEARPELENTIVFVCLGIELAARTWIEDWNRHRERKQSEHQGKIELNKIEVIELRTDAKYGNFIKHDPATAKVTIARSGDRIAVKIDDFISPTILKRLDMDLPLFKAKITDWRSQVDCVMIDTAYDGAVFNVSLSDVPEKKNDLVDGAYSLPAPTGKTMVAVKIIDMLGEEVFITEDICD